MEEVGYAKINLALHVRAREPHGYHRLETIFAFAEEGDRLTVSEGEGLTLTLTGPFAAGLGTGADNLVMRAAEALRARCGVAKGAALLLDKRLPVASGIGGGSADAAAALRLLRRWWQLDVDDDLLMEIGAALGADIPACLLSRTARGEGRGDRLSMIGGEELSGTALLLVNPGVPLSTAAVFAGWDKVDRGPLGKEPPLEAALNGRNDLEPAALALAPAIREVLAALSRSGAFLSRMSGSGATCFAMFESDAARDRAAGSIAASHPGWWQLASRLR